MGQVALKFIQFRIEKQKVFIQNLALFRGCEAAHERPFFQRLQEDYLQGRRGVPRDAFLLSKTF